MNIVKELAIKSLLLVYSKKRSIKLRSLIKKAIGKDKIQINYEGINLFVGKQSAIECNLLFDEYNEKNILKLISYFARKNYNFIDIGANIGVHTLIAAVANPEIETFSFEPEPNNFHDFIKNISLNNVVNIRPLRLGMGNFNGIIQMNINEGWNNGKHSMKVDFGTKQKCIKVPVIQLDVFKDNIPTTSLIIKIDVEGFEKEAIEGGLKVLKSSENIIIIIELLQEINGISGCNEITEMLIQNNFHTIYQIKSDGSYELVNQYQGSADYVFLKGTLTINDFNLYDARLN